MRTTWRPGHFRDSQVEKRTAWLRVYTVRELLSLFCAAGFESIETYGTLATTLFALGSRRLLVVATRGEIPA